MRLSLTLPVFILSVVFSTQLIANDVRELASEHSVNVTEERLLGALGAKGMSVFEIIDHAKGAEQAGFNLAPSRVVIFGNPKIGTKLMLCAPSIGLDLPLKMLIREGQDGKAVLSYTLPSFLKTKHSVKDCDPVFNKMTKALSNFAAHATGTTP